MFELKKNSVDSSSAELRLPFLEEKAAYFREHERLKDRKRWYYNKYVYYRYRIRQAHRIRWLKKLKLPLWLSFLRWILIDFIQCKTARFQGIYQFIGLPGQGKTISMVAHIKRQKERYPDLVIATNFGYLGEDYAITHWKDIIDIVIDTHKTGHPCLIAVDEIQNTFDATEWKAFPAPLYSLLTFNRKLEFQFLCSAQIYERIPSKIRNLANYTVICKNLWHADRLFRDYYFIRDDYEKQFEGKKAKAEFIRDFIADDEFYNSYDSFKQINMIKGRAEEEKNKRLEALQLLFGDDEA